MSGSACSQYNIRYSFSANGASCESVARRLEHLPLPDGVAQTRLTARHLESEAGDGFVARKNGEAAYAVELTQVGHQSSVFSAGADSVHGHLHRFTRGAIVRRRCVGATGVGRLRAAHRIRIRRMARRTHDMRNKR